MDDAHKKLLERVTTKRIAKRPSRDTSHLKPYQFRKGNSLAGSRVAKFPVSFSMSISRDHELRLKQFMIEQQGVNTRQDAIRLLLDIHLEEADHIMLFANDT